MTSIAASMRAILPGPCEPTTGSPLYVITGGTDRCVRYWDLHNVSKSFLVSGPSYAPSPNSALPTYSTQTVGPTTQYIETPPPTLLSSHAPLSGSTTSMGPAESSRFALNSGKQKPPPIHHHDAILDLEMLELPTRLLISASRDGVIKVWK